MLTKIWQSIQNWISRPVENLPPEIHYKKRTTQSHLLFHNPHKNQKQKLSGENKKFVQPQTKEELQSVYKVLCDEEKQNQESFQEENEKFFLQMSEMKEKLKELQICDQRIPDKKQVERVEKAVNLLNKLNTCEQKQGNLYRMFRREVSLILQTKYEGEKKDFPPILFQEYKKIKQIWELEGHAVDKLVTGSKYLKIKDLQLLGYGRWLNDEIISEYLNLIKEKLEENQKNRFGARFKILSSLQVTSSFSDIKYDERKVKRFFDRQGICNTDTLIMAIHKVNHWIFVKLNQKSLEIYDSIYQSNLQDYLRFPVIRNVLSYAAIFYGSTPQPRGIKSFPQQRNGYDCGMMMLCGIKDLVRRQLEWTFRQQEIPYKRLLFTKQLMEHKITGF